MLYRTKKLKINNFSVRTVVLAGVLSFPLVAKGESKKITAPNPVITMVLGVGVRMFRRPTDTKIENAAADIAKAGFTLTWAASPPVWVPHILDSNVAWRRSASLMAHSQKVASIFRKQDVGIAYGFRWHSLLPARSKTNTHLFGEILDPKTGTFGVAESRKKKKEKWNYGSERALQEFVRRVKMILKKIGPIEMFYVDEVIMGSSGKKAWSRKISTYWTSPTYSMESLASFRRFLAAKAYPDAASARFPITTVAVKPSRKANMGLPAIPLTPKNSDRLIADNNWPDSKLWKHWYEWRVQLYTHWLDTITTLAYEANKNNKNWLGCMYEMPVHWMVPALGQDLKQIVKLPHVDYVIAGYTTGRRYAEVKKIADAAEKKWGLQIEVSRYKHREGMSVDYIKKIFKDAVNDGASLITCYAGSTLIKSNVNVPENMRRNGWYYMPEQAKAWNSCIDWLKKNRGVKKLNFNL